MIYVNVLSNTSNAAAQRKKPLPSKGFFNSKPSLVHNFKRSPAVSRSAEDHGAADHSFVSFKKPLPERELHDEIRTAGFAKDLARRAESARKNGASLADAFEKFIKNKEINSLWHHSDARRFMSKELYFIILKMLDDAKMMNTQALHRHSRAYGYFKTMLECLGMSSSKGYCSQSLSSMAQTKQRGS